MMLPNHLLVIRAEGFAFNPQTAASNAFQHNNSAIHSESALEEFDATIKKLRKNNLIVTVIKDEDPLRPDAIFPNNWLAQIPNGPLCVFPMKAENRQREVRQDVIDRAMQITGNDAVLDVRLLAKEGEALEGTGSIVFHHPSQTAFACISERTSARLLDAFCKEIGYKAISFEAVTPDGKPIYHTNVLMTIGHTHCIICLEAITNQLEREMVKKQLDQCGLKIVPINYGQMNAFCANMLEVSNTKGERMWICSQTAHESLTMSQLWELAEQSEFVVADIQSIEILGGGGIRCLLAGLFI